MNRLTYAIVAAVKASKSRRLTTCGFGSPVFSADSDDLSLLILIATPRTGHVKRPECRSQSYRRFSFCSQAATTTKIPIRSNFLASPHFS